MKQFIRATRNKCKIKLGIQGPSGSGKTYSALLVAFGLTGDWRKIAVIDSENGSAHLYADLGEYSVLNLTSPFTPESYIEAIDAALKSGFECLVIDSLSAEWSGQGGVLDIHSNIPGNSFTAWSKVTPRHNAFVQKILQSDIHVIGTMRSKTDYIMTDKNGKQVPEKVGLKAVQREDAEYEFTVVFELNQRHLASVSKDRSGLFRNRPELVLNAEVGKEIFTWCNGGLNLPQPSADMQEIKLAPDQFEAKIKACNTVDELKVLFNENPLKQRQYRESFLSRQNELNVSLNYSSNGVHH